LSKTLLATISSHVKTAIASTGLYIYLYLYHTLARRTHISGPHPSHPVLSQSSVAMQTYWTSH